MNQAYGVGLPALTAQHAALNEAMGAGGMPGYVGEAYKGARTGITEGMTEVGAGEQAKADLAASGAVQGGNAASILQPQDIGAKLADAHLSSRTNEAIGNVDQSNKIMAMMLGMGTQAGSAANAAGGNQLNAISQMAPYNPTYAAILAGGSGAASIYGAGQDAGMWGKANPYTSAIQPGGTSGSSNWQGFNSGATYT